MKTGIVIFCQMSMSVHPIHISAGEAPASTRLVVTPVNATKSILENSAKHVCTIKLDNLC